MKDQKHKVQRHNWQSKKGTSARWIAQGRILLDFEGAHIHTKGKEKKKNKESHEKANIWEYDKMKWKNKKKEYGKSQQRTKKEYKK